MDFEFAKTDNPTKTSAISLNTIYYVDADNSYNVIKNVSKGNNEFIALKTIKGKGRLFFSDSESETVTEDTLLIFEYNKVRRYYCPDERWEFYWLNFSISDPIFFPTNKVIDIKCTENEKTVFSNCLALLRSEQSYSKALASSSFSSLLYTWLYSLKYENEALKQHYSSIKKVIDYLYVNIHQNIKVSQMAKMCGLSEKRFRDVFKGYTGKQPKLYYENMKMHFAQELLINTPFSIGEIANRLGYTNQFYFSRAFNQFHGATPSKYKSDNIRKN